MRGRNADPGAFLICIGGAAAIVGAIAYFVPIDLTSQLLLFGALVAALVLIGRRVYGSLDASQAPCRRAARMR